MEKPNKILPSKNSENIDQIISTKQIDAMFICVPPDKHEYFIKKCNTDELLNITFSTLCCAPQMASA